MLPPSKTFRPEAGQQIRDAYNESPQLGQLVTARVVYGTPHMLSSEARAMDGDPRFGELSHTIRKEIIAAAQGATITRRAVELSKHPHAIEKRRLVARAAFDGMSFVRLIRHLAEVHAFELPVEARLQSRYIGGHAAMLENMPPLGLASYDLLSRDMNSADIDRLLFPDQPNGAVKARLAVATNLQQHFERPCTPAHGVAMLYGVKAWKPIAFADQLAQQEITSHAWSPKTLLWPKVDDAVLHRVSKRRRIYF